MHKTNDSDAKRLPGIVTGVTPKEETETGNEISHFILDEIAKDVGPGGRMEGRTVITRFPPEPNGYLHIGHAKAIVIDFGTAEIFGGLCNMRMDDTNPEKEDVEYVEAIKEDVHWLGYDWDDPVSYTHLDVYKRQIWVWWFLAAVQKRFILPRSLKVLSA